MVAAFEITGWQKTTSLKWSALCEGFPGRTPEYWRTIDITDRDDGGRATAEGTSHVRRSGNRT